MGILYEKFPHATARMNKGMLSSHVRELMIEEYSGVQDILEIAIALIPSALTAEDVMEQYDIRIDEYGYVHDTGFHVILSARKDLGDDCCSLYGYGWESFKQDYDNAVSTARKRWQYCVEYGYH